MSCAIGLDIGGTKIAGAAFDAKGKILQQITKPVPPSYENLLYDCKEIVGQLEQTCGVSSSLGVCAPYADNHVCANIPYLIGTSLQDDLEKTFARSVPLENDANCAALAEAQEGAGQGYGSVFGLIMGTGIGGGFVVNGRVFSGVNGICGEIGHLPLPYYEEQDGERVPCGCGQSGCIEKLIAGPALARLYRFRTGKHMEAKEIAEQANLSDKEALSVLDRYYTVVAKAMVAIMHSFDPEIITVSGGLNDLPGLYSEVPQRWKKYALAKEPKTKFVPATFGAMAGLRGASLLRANF